MRKEKRMLALLLSAALLISMPVNALAAGKGKETKGLLTETEEESAEETAAQDDEDSLETIGEAAQEESSAKDPSAEAETELSEEDLAEAARVQAEFDEYMLQLFREDASANLINLHYLLEDPSAYGITEYDISFGDYSVISIEESYEEEEQILEDMEGFSYDLLTKDQQITYDILKDQLETDLQGRDYILYTEVLSPTTGVQAELPILMAEYVLGCQQDVEDYLELLKQFPDYFGQILDFEKEKAAAGLFMSDTAVDDIVDSCSAFLEDQENHYLITTFNERMEEADFLTQEQKEAYEAANREIFADYVVPAYEQMISVLTEMKGQGTNEKGLAGLPEGRQYYEYLVASVTGTEYSVEEVEDLVINSLNSELQKVSLLAMADSDLISQYSTFSFSLTDPAEILEDLREKTAEDFPALPDTDYTIKYVPKALEEELSPAFYLTPQMDDYSMNSIYINNGSLDESNLYSTLAHEGFPGHLLQTVYSLENLRAPILALVSCSGYSEGWGTYAEMYAYMLDDGNSSALLKLMKYNGEATLGLYALADLLIHYEGWTFEDIQGYLSDYFGVTDEDMARTFYNYIVESPANYLEYYLGYLEFCQMRDEAEEELGEDFSLKEYNTFVLDMGECSFRVLKQYFAEWLETQKEQKQITADDTEKSA